MTAGVPTTLSICRAGDRVVMTDVGDVKGEATPHRSYNLSSDDALIIGRELVRIGAAIAKDARR